MAKKPFKRKKDNKTLIDQGKKVVINGVEYPLYTDADRNTFIRDQKQAIPVEVYEDGTAREIFGTENMSRSQKKQLNRNIAANEKAAEKQANEYARTEKAFRRTLKNTPAKEGGGIEGRPGDITYPEFMTGPIVPSNEPQRGKMDNIGMGLTGNNNEEYLATEVSKIMNNSGLPYEEAYMSVYGVYPQGTKTDDKGQAVIDPNVDRATVVPEAMVKNDIIFKRQQNSMRSEKAFNEANPNETILPPGMLEYNGQLFQNSQMQMTPEQKTMGIDIPENLDMTPRGGGVPRQYVEPNPQNALPNGLDPLTTMSGGFTRLTKKDRFGNDLYVDSHGLVTNNPNMTILKDTNYPGGSVNPNAEQRDIGITPGKRYYYPDRPNLNPKYDVYGNVIPNGYDYNQQFIKNSPLSMFGTPNLTPVSNAVPQPPNILQQLNDPQIYYNN